MQLHKKILIVALVIFFSIIIKMYISNIYSNKDSLIINENQIKEKNISIMYETDTGEYVESSETNWPSSGYVFNENLSRCENGSALVWDDENKQIILSSKISDKCYVFFDIKLTFAEYIKSIYINNSSDQTLLYHDGSMENGINDLSYRYSGASNVVNNYVCFGSDAIQCPYENLYRIIGIFDDDKDVNYNVKLIKNDYATSAQLGTNGDYDGRYLYGNSNYKGNNYANISSYYWNNNTQRNTWSASRLNTINLNTNYISYLNSLGSAWTTKIADTTWIVGGNTDTNIIYVTPKVANENEIIKPAADIKYSAKIGLMYVSDYGYAASQNSWTRTLYNYESSTITQNNWMYMGLYEWTISPDTDGSSYAFPVNTAGHMYTNIVYIDGAIRPVFYLNSNVELKSGAGTADSPYRI